MIKTSVEEFKLFYALLKDSVDERKIKLIPIVALDKLPDVPKGKSWLDPDVLLSYDQAIQRLREGKNVGIVGNAIPNGYAIVDIDYYDDPVKGEELKTDLGPTLIIKTPNGGYHLFFRTPNFISNAVATAPYHGEIRARNYYVVACGSAVKSKSGNIETYKVERESILYDLYPEHIPKCFQNKSYSEEQVAGLNIPKDKFKFLSEVKNKFNFSLEDIAVNSTKLFSLLTSPSKVETEAQLRGYNSVSEEDYAVVSILKYYEFDESTIAKVFMSFRYRPKFSRNKNYLERTIKRCIPQSKISDIIDFASWTPLRITDEWDVEASKFIIEGDFEEYLENFEEDNLITDVVDYITERTDGYKEYAFMSGIHLLSNIVGRDIRVSVTPEVLLLKVWCILLGNSTIARKSTVINLYRKLLCNSHMVNRIYAPRSFSNEGFLSRVGNVVKDSKSYSVDELNDSITYLFCDEIGGFLSNIAKEYNSDAQDTFMSLYDDSLDGISHERTLAKARFIMKNDFLTIVGGTTPTRLFSKIKENDAKSGFLPRFLFCFPQHNKEYKKQQALNINMKKKALCLTSDIDALHTQIRELGAYIKNTSSLSYISLIPSDKGFNKHYEFTNKLDEYMNKLPDNERDLAEPFINRLQNYNIKFASLMYIGSREFRNKIKLLHDKIARGEQIPFPEQVFNFTIPDKYFDFSSKLLLDFFVSYIQSVISEIISKTTKSVVEELYHIIKSEVTRTGNPKISRINLLRKSHMTSQRFQTVLLTLIDRGDVVLGPTQQEVEAGTKEKTYVRFLR